MRSPYQVLVFPYCLKDTGEITYCIFKRRDLNVWQGIAGGGEDDELPIEAAKRESLEEAGITTEHQFLQLNSIANIPSEAIGGYIWGKDVITVPEYAFGVEVSDQQIKLDDEHTQYEWLAFKEAFGKLHWQSNRTALEELHQHLAG